MHTITIREDATPEELRGQAALADENAVMATETAEMYRREVRHWRGYADVLRKAADKRENAR